MPDHHPPTIKQQRDLKHEMKEQRRQAAARSERIKTTVTWSIVGAVVLGIVALIIFGRGGAVPTNTNVAPVTDQDHVRGPLTAKAVVIEYSDLQCPACGAYYPVMKALETKYGDRLVIAYRHFPLSQLHRYAELAARSTEAANRQGKFWEMHDLLFERQGSWPEADDVKQTMIDYANELKLDVTKFKTDLDSTVVKDRVSRDVTSGNAIGINSTPTFFLNGKKLANPGNEEEFSKLIDITLAGT